MADGSYDNTNSGVIFSPHNDQSLSGQGKVNIEGEDHRTIMIFEKLSRDKPPVLVLYQRMGVLFPNDKKGNEKAPDFSGPLDAHKDHRIAAWKGEKDGRKYMSLKVSQRENQQGSSEGANGNDGWSDPGSGFDGDEIPF